MSCNSRWAGVVLFSVSVVVAGACSGGTGNTTGNTPPHAVDLFLTSDEDMAVEIPILNNVTDPDGDPLTVTMASAPGHHVEVINGQTLKLVPALNFSGTLHLGYSVTDGTNVVQGAVTVIIRPVNDAPVATDGTLNVHGPTTVMLTGSDVEGDPLTFEVVAMPAHGTLTGTPPGMRYVPDVDFLGEDAIVFRAKDGMLASRQATLLLEISRGPAPVALPISVSVNEDVPVKLPLAGSDPDQLPLTFMIVTPPEHGTVSGPPDFVYTPAKDFTGDDSLEFAASNGYVVSAPAKATLVVAPVNDAPVADPQSVVVTEDISQPITLTGHDIEGDPLTFSQATSPSHGFLQFSGPNRRVYIPDANYHGPDSFTFTASDARLTSAPATVTIEVISVEDPPVAMPVSVALAEDTSTAITLVGGDGDGDPISYAIATPPAHGTLTGPPPAMIYMPAADYHGPDAFTYTVASRDQISAPGTVAITVTSVNDAPVAISSAVTTDEDTPVAIVLQASDVDLDGLSFTIVDSPIDGTLIGSGANRIYTPAPNTSGQRTLSFTVSDGRSSSNTATVTITINPINDPPTTRDDFALTMPGTPITFDVLNNDFDVEHDTFTLDAVDQPGHGTAEPVGRQIHYTPAAGFIGTDVFGYTVVDSHGASARGFAHVGVGEFPPGEPAEVLVTIGGSINTGEPRRTPAISGDGRYIAFTSALALVGADTNNVEDVYLYDRGTHSVTRVSVTTDGAQANNESRRPHISADGRYIVFESIATNLVAGDSNARSDVFRHDRLTGETIRVSVASGGVQASGDSFDAEVSDDGNLIAFTSTAFDLVDNDANGASDIFVRDLAADTTTRISVSSTGGEADVGSTEPALSGDGRYVAFTSSATNLVADDHNNLSDVFLRDTVTGATTRISVSSTGGEANHGSTGPSLSRDGRFVSFLSDATNLVPAGPTGTQVYVHDRQGLTTTRSDMPASFVWARLSADGRYLTAYALAGAVYIRDRLAGVTLTTLFSGAWPAISANGRYVAWIDAFQTPTLRVVPNPP